MSREMGKAAYIAVHTSEHYMWLRGAPVEDAERLFLPSDNPETPLQFSSPLVKSRLEFREGWRKAADEDME